MKAVRWVSGAQNGKAKETLQADLLVAKAQGLRDTEHPYLLHICAILRRKEVFYLSSLSNGLSSHTQTSFSLLWPPWGIHCHASFARLSPKPSPTATFYSPYFLGFLFHRFSYHILYCCPDTMTFFIFQFHSQCYFSCPKFLSFWIITVQRNPLSSTTEASTLDSFPYPPCILVTNVY